MTDHHLDPLDPLDDLASAHVDGHTAPEDAGRMSSDPEIAARIAAFEAIHAAIGTDTGPVDATRRDAAISAALDAFQPAPATASLAEARLRSRAGWRRRALLAAAAVAAVAIAVPLIARRGDHASSTVIVAAPDRASSTTAATTATESAAASGDAATAPKVPAPTGPTGERGTALLAPAAAPAPEALGSYSDLDALATAARAQLGPLPASAPGSTTAPPTPTTEAPAATTTTAIAPTHDDMTATTAATTTTSTTVATPSQACLDQRQQAARAADQSVLLSGTATVGGRPVDVVVTEDQQGHRTMTAADPAAGCTVVGSRAL